MNNPFDDAPLPRHPELQAMIRAARAQPAPPVRVRYEDIQAARRRSNWRVALVAAAAGIVAVVGWASTRPSEPDAAPTIAVADAEPAGAVDRPTVPFAQPATQGPEPSVELASGLLVRRLDEGPLPDDDRLGAGEYHVRTQDAGASVTVGAKVLEIAAASEVFIDSTAPEVTFTVRSGSARWAAPKTKRTSSSERPDASELAAQAEAAIVAGKHADAARLLRRLVRQSPSGAAAKTALIDLARLEKKLGRPARAHCAYAAFLARFPADARAPSVRTADEDLGVAKTCRGLEPR